MNSIHIKDLIKLLHIAFDTEGEDLEIVTTGHYGEPFGYHKSNFHVKTVDVDKGINSIKPRKVFNIEWKDIGPEPD